MSSLVIDLENEYVCMDEGCSIHVKGNLYLKLGSDQHTRIYSSSIRLIGTERISEEEDKNIMDDVYRLSSSEWQSMPSGQHYLHPFLLHLPKDLPLTFSHRYGSIDYTLKAIIHDDPPLIAVRTLYLYRRPPLPISSSLPSLHTSSCSSCSSSISDEFVEENRSKLCWGLSHQAQWQYELELPQWIDATQSFVCSLRTRMRHHQSNSSLTSCMIGIQLYESIEIGLQTNEPMILLTTSQVLVQPSSTWTCPCTIPVFLHQLPTSSTFRSPRIHVHHHLCITLNYCSPLGQSDTVHLECIVPLIVPPSLSSPSLHLPLIPHLHSTEHTFLPEIDLK
ncbi:uncharacterized protein BX664DRAFT_388341 [Halteromyces radiatus]|uniref:uncharacterized protein n=1 Tax=Halteromyces radiatus TaxID=101107 RepID=UPI002220E23E|nr:uncharacterized protein BX664DRAFT_388341 [Halteromyces radiatus]KAI8081341.1 hypothetical protein BX664DRAFT_388341 [Halteromyces radiatus]